MNTARNTRATRTNTPAKRFYRPDELSEMTGIPPRTLKHWRATGYGPKHAMLGGRVRYPVNEAEKFMADPQGYQAAREMEIDLT